MYGFSVQRLIITAFHWINAAKLTYQLGLTKHQLFAEVNFGKR